MQRNILDGLRVLDFTWVLAGPFATRILADFGAEVIKVQSKKTARGAEANNTGYFNTWNRNKRSITLDMSYPEAKQIALRLATISDVVIENFSPRVTSNWGMNYEKLKERRPDLIMVSISAMGHTGPWKNYRAFGQTIQALSGLTYLTSFRQNSPMGLGYAYSDAIVGLYAALAVLAALECRDRTGHGQHIDISEYEAACTLLGPTLMNESAKLKEMFPQGNRAEHIPAAPYGCYKCRGIDRWCVIAVFTDGEWQGLCRIMGNPAWTRDDRFSTLPQRQEHARELDELLGQWTARHTPEEVVDFLQGAGISAGVVQNAEDLANDPHLRAREFFISLEHPVLGMTISDSSPIRFKQVTKAGWKASPSLGKDNEYVYTELLSFTEAELSSYVRRGIIG